MPLIRLFHLLAFCVLTSCMFAQTDGQQQLRVKNATFASMNRGGDLHIPYPILYVHGLVGSDATWQEMSDWLESALGEAIDLEFSLNADGSLYTSDASDDVESFIPGNLEAGNQYIINFNCAASGNCASSGSLSQSNQAGIYKQGEAIGMAIDAILDATGRSKVILLGHSMGGVACRQYLQNNEHWQGTTHRVAKLVTSGSPHVGFDLGSKLGKWGGLFEGIDSDSEAMRDLKNEHTGFGTSTPGVFFWGGEEDQDYMYDDIFYWWNVDVNCNGSTGEEVVGLNERSMYNDLEFAGLFDTYDLVVTDASADYNFTGETTGGEDLCAVLNYGWTGDFHCESWGWDVPGGVTLGHNELPEQLIETLWALDEADDYVNSYEVNLNQWYTGFLTPQAISSDGYQGYNGPYASDWDDFIISIPLSGGTLTVSAEFDGVAEGADFLIYEVNSGQYIASIENVDAFETLNTTVTGGQYIIEFNENVSYSDAFGQYFFQATLNQSNSVEEDDLSDVLLTVWPNPATDIIQFNTNLPSSSSRCIELFDAQGKKMYEMMNTSKTTIDVSSFPKGSYTLVFHSQEHVVTRKIAIQ
jgi:pimeloyl-ACP methyl ester carboxylesterase